MLRSSASFTVLPAADINRARQFYRDKLGMEPTLEQGGMIMYGSATAPDFLIYETPHAGTAQNTQICWLVGDIRSAMTELRSSGVIFEEYDSENLKTVDGVAELDGEYSAWFRDSEGNFLCLSQPKA
ncbi:VOC family protein [Mycetocola sp. 2940]|uniref:VOC family protein n=1 Tax=Mycetocola sp. 2940 TaxID=3156452 RepID=UPI0033928A01